MRALVPNCYCNYVHLCTFVASHLCSVVFMFQGLKCGETERREGGKLEYEINYP